MALSGAALASTRHAAIVMDARTGRTLYDRMRKGLSMTAGRDLLLLCAWAYAQKGEHDEAKFAWQQARDREGSHRLDVAMPKLAEWMASYGKERPDLDDPPPDEDL